MIPLLESVTENSLEMCIRDREGANWMDIRSDRQRGLSYTEIARKYNIDPRTARKYAQSETRPVYSLSAAKPSKLDPYKEQIAI